VLPAPERGSQLRRVASRFSDPVSTALVEGSLVARFPPTSGFSAADWGRRAIAERSAQAEEWSTGSELRRIGALFNAARAAIFSDSIAAGDAELPLTVAATAARLVELSPSRRGAIEACSERFRTLREAEGNGSAEDTGAVRELTDAVEGLIAVPQPEIGVEGRLP
jgi:hypothetical protein